MADTVRVFLGTEPKTKLMADVLSHTLRKHASGRLEITYMIGKGWEYPLDGIKVGTGFSLRRWMIPQHCRWQGRAVYMDADVQCFGDIRGLWEFGDKLGSGPGKASCAMTWQADKHSVERSPQSSVFVVDCAAAYTQGWGWRIDEILQRLRAGDKATYVALMHAKWMSPIPTVLPDFWNHFNTYEPGRTKLTHYTYEDRQPIYQPQSELAPLWQAALEEAIKAKAVSKADFEHALAQWQVKEDWRSTNGLHPFYRKYLPLFG